VTFMATIGTAPVSFGIFGDVAVELTPRQLVDAIAAAGYQATELGPPGMLGSPEETAALMAAAELEVVGAYVPFDFDDAEVVFAEQIKHYARTLDELEACGTAGSLAILADEGSDLLRRTPRRTSQSGLGWGPPEWDRVADRIQRAAEMASARHIDVSFHPHLTTFVENADEVDELLRRTTVDLTVDSAHFLLGGMDPAERVRSLAHRINHIHVKDVDLGAVPPNETAQFLDVDEWWGDLAAPLGDGDVDLDDFLDSLAEVAVRWIVIEQDRDPLTVASLGEVIAGESANRRWLEQQLGARGWSPPRRA